ncbi:MAG: sugar O-acetyltransferase [Roseburia sp.]|nr:sugar O-acetyltransferase [Roseburia sp.]
MLSGRLYKCDATLRQELSAARRLTSAYNRTTYEEESERAEILQKLFKYAGEGAYIEPPFRCDYGSHISVGDGFYANFNCIMLDVANIKIGDHVYFGPSVNIYTACHPIYAPVRNEGFEYAKEVTIGDDVWIGGNVTINPGVHIGSNVVIGSGSVVTGDIPDGVVAAGNPCRILRRISDSDKQYWEEKKEEHDS